MTTMKDGSTNNKRHLRIIGSGRSHEVLKDILSDLTPCKVLDVPVGTGVLSSWLVEQGCEVMCADIDAGNFGLHGHLPFTEVNLNRVLPFDNETFDTIVSANGLHRLFNMGGAIREFARIMKADGHLLINVNNYASIVNRMRFVLCGSVSHIFDEPYFEQTIDDPEANVRLPIVFGQIAAHLKATGLEIVEVRAVDLLQRHKIARLVGLPMRWLSLLTSRFTRHPDFARWNAHPAVMLGGSYLVVVARKMRNTSNP